MEKTKSHTVNLESGYQKNPDMVFRELLGEGILVPIRQNVGDLECIFSLNDTASRFWVLMDGERSLQEIRDQITSEFEVDPEQAEEDLVELVVQLEEIGALSQV